jgi:hypothetical protein
MSAATQAIKVVVVIIAVGAAAKSVRARKNGDDSSKGVKKPVTPPVKVSPVPGPGTKKPDPIRTGGENG